jgi:hypothetical protein
VELVLRQIHSKFPLFRVLLPIAGRSGDVVKSPVDAA